MKEFTFFTLSFNQEKYIIQHLESIKYQIENYGENYLVHYIICDDSSKDNTVYYVRKWLAGNKKLFKSITIIVNDDNCGTVSNMINGLSKIKTDYKMLAADDLYFNRNIFTAKGNNDIVLSPVVVFDDQNNVIYDFDNNKYLYYLSYYKKTNLLNIIRRDLKYNYPLKTPGIFYDLGVSFSEGVLNVLKQCRLIEDLPMWIYFTNIKNNYRCAIELNPYILYRKDVGVSYNLKSNSPFLVELKRKYNLGKAIRYGKWFNPYRYLMWINNKMIEQYARSYYKNNNEEYLVNMIREAAYACV